MNIVVIGAQWGDEGKGKIVDYLAGDASVVTRFSGGANAGHTIVNGGVTYKLHLVPSGIVYPGKTVILGTGMVIDVESLFAELKTLEEQGIAWKGRVLISERAHLVFPTYKAMDLEMEKKRRNPIGTTGRGIGIAYAQKADRDGVRCCDLFNPDVYKTLKDEEKAFIEPYMSRIKEMIVDPVSYMAERKDANKLFEGAQGALLDIDTGTYPYVSSGYSIASGACAGGGIGALDIDAVYGVFKAYNTRVGNGPFPTEFDHNAEGELENKVRVTGREFGVTTGRPRRCGYLDLVALKYACRANSISDLVLTHLDIYDDMEEIKVCTAYEHEGKKITDFPARVDILEKAKPLYQTFKGWKKNISGTKKYEDLPQKAREYVEFIEKYTETPITIISVGYERDDTMIRKPVWTK
ncbi:MAG: adenylosuccinate synthase [Spirochaetia bacterium]|nr:adenylosuccinate synthase [Spirochaetia bacterium]MBR4796768.1 adenylosuccinate synthase [Spirochaetia bacterium]